MKTTEITPPTTAELPLSMIFGEEWKAFTDDQMDEKIVAAIVNNANHPQNSAHHSTTEGVTKAAEEFISQNETEFFKAVDILEGRC